jgi:hypothetical protein
VQVKTALPPTVLVAGTEASDEERLHADERGSTADRFGDPHDDHHVAGNYPTNEVRPGGGDVAPKVFLVERLSGAFEEGPRNTNGASADTSTVIVFVVRDPDRLLRERGLGFHGDVVDLLTDFVLNSMDQYAGEGSSE